jgi:diadenosine tetraphosphatase ApaH/serine/threonine PP2A family protein phosphatase
MLNEAVHSRRRHAPDPVAISSIVACAADLFSQENGTLTLTGNQVIVGDIHGNIGVLLQIFEKTGYPPGTSNFFLGDYVDRGEHSFEVIVPLYLLKVIAPDSLHLLRGSDEFVMMSEIYGFRRECEQHWSLGLYEQIVGSFMALPISAIFGRAFCVHGGISPQLQSRAAVEAIAKSDGGVGTDLVSDLVWSDPRDGVEGFDVSPRGCGPVFGEDAMRRFTEATRLDRIIRARALSQWMQLALQRKHICADAVQFV